MSDKKITTGRRIARASLYLIPGYPIIKTLRSAKEAIAGGAQVIADQNRELAEQRRSPRTRTWNEALAARSEDALPLREIQRLCVRRKQLAMALGFVAICFVLHSAFGGKLVGTALGTLFVLLCLMFMLKYEHQLWQMATGPAAPDEPLGGLSRFIESRGAVGRLFNAHLARKGAI